MPARWFQRPDAALLLRGAIEAQRNYYRAVIGRLEKTVFDCPEPRKLATFYAEVLGMQVTEDSEDWVVIGLRPGLRQLAFQRSERWTPPTWPDSLGSQQLHLDIRVDDVDAAEQAALALGATVLSSVPGTGFRVYSDPAGHPFCFVFERTAEGER